MALALAVIVIGLAAVVAARHFARSPVNSTASAAELRQEAAARAQAAGWIVQQVSPDVTVSCDRVMCAALTARGFPPREVVVLGPTSPDPVPAVLVVETAAVHSLFGSSLAAAWAPVVLAAFGSGTAGITVRVVAPHGASAQATALRADLADRKTAGAALLNNNRIVFSAAAQKQLVAGQVDSRLLAAVASLATSQPIDVVEFGNVGLGAGPGIPLRFADLAENDQAAHLHRAAYTQALHSALSQADAPFRPARTVSVVLPDGQAVLRVEFTAPSPLGLFSAQGS